VGRNGLRSENGVAIIIALIMLLILTFIGISAITTTTFEANISGNEKVGANAFYSSEAGIHVGVNQLPDTKPIPRTKIGEDSYYWSGGPKDKESAKSLSSLGLYAKAGYDSSWAFKRYQINATGESFLAMKEIEVQASYGPFPASTQY
jgi:hypothetical protein